MEKNEWKQRLWQSYAFRKILIIMKLTMLLFFVALFQFWTWIRAFFYLLEDLFHLLH